MKGRKTLRRAGIVLAFGALLSAGMLASGALGMTSGITGSTDSTSTDTALPPTTSTLTDPTTTTSESTTTELTTAESTTTESTTTTPAPTFSPTIVSDKADYSPGATVTLSSSGWPPADAVHIFVNDDAGQSWSYNADVTADIGGTFTLQFPLPDRFIADYSVTASDASGLRATASFTDANFTFDSTFAVYPYRLAGGLVNIQTGGNGTGDHFLWNRKLPSGTYAYTGLTFNGSSNGSGQNLSFGATATGTYEINVGASGTTAPSTACGGSSCGHYGIWGPNQASFNVGQSLTIAGGGAKQSQASGASAVTVKLFNPSNVQVGSSITLATDANGEYSSGTIRTFSSTDPGGTWKVEISSGARYDNNTGFTHSTNITVVSDTTAPTVTVTTHNAVPANSWFTSSPQQVDASATDSSNVTNISCTVDGSSATVAGQSGSNPRTGTVSVSGDGTHPVVCTATDGAGNSGAASGSSNTVTVKIDTTAPSIVFDSATPAANADGWNKTNVVVSWNCSDNVGGSGAAAASVSQTISSEGTGLAATGTCADVAGNTASNTKGGFKIDKTDPSIVCPLPAPVFTLNQSPANVVASFTDGGSGPASGSSSTAANTSSVGGKTAILSATDIAGNTSSKSCTYSVGFQFSGLFAPIDKPNTMNVSKAGQAIPLKWRLLDANNQPVTTLTNVVVKVTDVSCSLGVTTDLIEEYAAGSSGLQNLGSGNYLFAWKTPTSYLNSCKLVGLDLGEGSVRTPLALITFSK
jgi:hypothetical protein